MNDLEAAKARELLERSEKTRATLTSAAGKLDGYIELLKSYIATAEEKRGGDQPSH